MLGIFLSAKIIHPLLGSFIFPLMLIVSSEIDGSVFLKFVIVVLGMLDFLLLGQFILILFLVDIYEFLGLTISLGIKRIIMNILQGGSL